MSDLTAAVLAAIAERWKDAEAATPGGAARWRTGRKVGRTLYRSWHEPRDDDPLIGVMDETEAATFIAANDPTFSLANLDSWEAVVRRHELTTEDYTEMWWADRSKPPGTYVVTGCDRCRHAGVDGDEYLTPGLCDDLATVARLFLSVEQLAEHGIEPVPA